MGPACRPKVDPVGEALAVYEVFNRLSPPDLHTNQLIAYFSDKKNQAPECLIIKLTKTVNLLVEEAFQYF
jgi:hypothetical protein